MLSARVPWCGVVLLAWLLLPAAAGADPAPASPIRVMTFNIRYGTADDGDDSWTHRRQLVIDVIRNHEPDVVGLQEALHAQLEELLQALPGFASIGVGRADGATKGEYAAILFRKERFERDEREHGTFWLSDTPEVPGSRSFGNTIERICTWARLVDRASRRAVYVYNAHLDHRSQRSRERSTELIARRIRARSRADDPFIFMGDLNAAPENAAVTSLLAAFGDAEAAAGPRPGLIDCYRLVHPPSSSEGTFNGFAGRTDGPRIDYIFASPGFGTRSASIVRDHEEGRYPSDHFPVTAELEWATVPDRGDAPRPAPPTSHGGR